MSYHIRVTRQETWNISGIYNSSFASKRMLSPGYISIGKNIQLKDPKMISTMIHQPGEFEKEHRINFVYSKCEEF